MEYRQELLTSLQRQWGIHAADDLVAEEEILRQLEDRIMLLMDKNPEYFFLLMYRLDIPEDKLRATLNDPTSGSKIARLVYERQHQKICSRKRYSSPPDPDAELRW